MASRKVDAKLQELLDAIAVEGKVSVELNDAVLERLHKHLQEHPSAAPQPRDGKPAAPKRVWDTKVPKLCLRVMPTGVMSFNVQWSRRGATSLGKFPGLPLKTARSRAQEAIVQASGGSVPEAAKAKLPAPRALDDGLTVAGAGAAYVKALKKDKRAKAAKDAELRFARILDNDPLGRVPLERLHEDDLTAWRERLESGNLAPMPGKRGRPPAAKPMSPAAFKRNLTVLKAALNLAVARRRVPAERALEWNAVKPEKDADGSRDLYLDITQRRALLDHAEADIRDVMTCVLLTGCRAGDPAATLRKDYEAHTGSVTFRTKNHERRIPLSPEARALLDRLAKSKLPNAHMFTKADGRPWTSTDVSDAVKKAAAAAELPEGVVLTTLRHCWITDAIVGGMDLLTVSKIAGTSMAMIEKTYGHLLDNAARERLSRIKMI